VRARQALAPPLAVPALPASRRRRGAWECLRADQVREQASTASRPRIGS